MTDKLVIMCTSGVDNPELAIIPFVMATAAQASDIEVLLGFQGSGVMLVRRGVATHVVAAGFPSLNDLIEAYRELGGKMYVCGPCVSSRNIDPENEFIEGATVVNAVTFVKECVEATNVIVY